MCLTELTFLARRDITAAPVAASIVHEGMHARVHAMRERVFRAGDDPSQMPREERLCRRAELDFGRALPDELGAPVVERRSPRSRWRTRTSRPRWTGRRRRAAWRKSTGSRSELGVSVARGLVVGKFLPYHLGHAHLIRAARAQVDELTVLVCSNAREPIPGGYRYQWVRQAHPDCRVVHAPRPSPTCPRTTWRGCRSCRDTPDPSTSCSAPRTTATRSRRGSARDTCASTASAAWCPSRRR